MCKQFLFFLFDAYSVFDCIVSNPFFVVLPLLRQNFSLKNVFFCSSRSEQSLPRCYMKLISYSIPFQLSKSKSNLYCCHSQNWSFGTNHLSFDAIHYDSKHVTQYYTEAYAAFRVLLPHDCSSEFETNRTLNNKFLLLRKITICRTPWFSLRRNLLHKHSCSKKFQLLDRTSLVVLIRRNTSFCCRWWQVLQRYFQKIPRKIL